MTRAPSPSSFFSFSRAYQWVLNAECYRLTSPRKSTRSTRTGALSKVPSWRWSRHNWKLLPAPFSEYNNANLGSEKTALDRTPEKRRKKMRALRGSRVLADCVVLRNARDMYIFVFVCFGRSWAKVRRSVLSASVQWACVEGACASTSAYSASSKFPPLVEFRGICCYFVRWVSLTLFA